jgi:regulator of replication initiation timing
MVKVKRVSEEIPLSRFKTKTEAEQRVKQLEQKIAVLERDLDQIVGGIKRHLDTIIGEEDALKKRKQMLISILNTITNGVFETEELKNDLNHCFSSSGPTSVSTNAEVIRDFHISKAQPRKKKGSQKKKKK